MLKAWPFSPERRLLSQQNSSRYRGKKLAAVAAGLANVFAEMVIAFPPEWRTFSNRNTDRYRDRHSERFRRNTQERTKLLEIHRQGHLFQGIAYRGQAAESFCFGEKN